MLELSSLDLGEIAIALADHTGYEHRWLINPETGEIVFWTSDTGIDGHTPVDLDELDLIGIHPLPSYIWYQDMADFAEQVSDDRAGRRLARAIQGKGAFRRFKDELNEEYPHLLPAWYAFRDARACRRASAKAPPAGGGQRQIGCLGPGKPEAAIAGQAQRQRQALARMRSTVKATWPAARERKASRL